MLSLLSSSTRVVNLQQVFGKFFIRFGSNSVTRDLCHHAMFRRIGQRMMHRNSFFPQEIPQLVSGYFMPVRNYAALPEQQPKIISTSTASKKRTKRKAETLESVTGIVENTELEMNRKTFPVVAFATCEELDLENMKKGIITQALYVITTWDENLPLDSALHDAVHVTAKYSISDESREIFFFRDGTVVFWNVPDLERYNVLNFLKEFQKKSYASSEVMQESEFLMYTHAMNDTQKTTKLTGGKICLKPFPTGLILDKYTVANAMALSVKLGIWESTLEKFVESIDHITDQLRDGKPLKLTRAAVLRKTGELFSLRNELNLNSDLLDTPDFYWEHDELEYLYQKMYSYLSISRRTSVMNEKLTQCYELLELISGYLNDRHHTRLEWMIIALISIEVILGLNHLVTGR